MDWCKICTRTKPHQWLNKHYSKMLSRQTENNIVLCEYRAVCSFSFAFQSAPWGTWKEHDCTEWRRFPYVCHTCVPVNHTPSRTNLTDLKCRLRRHGSMVNMISDSSLSYWGNIEKAEQYTHLQNTVFKWWLHKNQITDSRPVIWPSGPMILTQRN